MSVIIGGQVVGVSIGGRGGNTSGWTEQTVGGVPIKFQPGDKLAVRQVQIGGGMTTTLMAGSSTSMNVNGISVRSQGQDLWVNGEKVNFSGGAPVDADVAKKSAKEELEGRFPGVHFNAPELVTIDESVKIAAGARIDGASSGTVITGDSKIGPEAHISGGAVEGSIVDGTVRNANLRDSKVLRGGVATEANIRDTTIESGGRISGGNVRDCVVKGGGSISGGNVRDMTIEQGANLTGGNVRGFTLKTGQSITGGNHQGSISSGDASGPSVVIRGGNFSSENNIVLGNVSGGVSVIGDLVATGLRIGGATGSRVTIGTSGGTITIG